MRLPPGVSSKDFSAAMQRFEKVVGKDWVFTSDDDVDLYRDPYTPAWHEEEEKFPSAAVAPASVEEVQAVVKIANQYKIPLWPVSTGKNLAYGGTSPALSGTAILDLKRMDRVLEVNERNHYALVEPGVSYFDLYRYIQENKLKVWIDPPDPGWGGLSGEYARPRRRANPMHEHFAAQCGMEVVLANGEVMRTGMGAMPNSKTWQQYKYGFGPYIDGMFLPIEFRRGDEDGRVAHARAGSVSGGNRNGAEARRSRALGGHCGAAEESGDPAVDDSPGQSSALLPASQGQSMLDVPGGPSIAEMDRLGAEKNLAYWSADLRFYGPAKVINAQWEYAKEKLSSIPGAKFRDDVSYTFPFDFGAAGQGNELARDRHSQPIGIRNPEKRLARTHRLLADHSHERRSRVRNAESFRPGIH